MGYEIPADHHNSGIAPSADTIGHGRGVSELKNASHKITSPSNVDGDLTAAVFTAMCRDIHQDNVRAGWWHDIKTGIPLDRNFGELLCLVHSEISEAMEGDRKNLADDKLPQYPMAAVELGDAVIRICDIAGSRGWDLGTIIQAKREYNRNRADHKPENRLKEGGKTY